MSKFDGPLHLTIFNVADRFSDDNLHHDLVHKSKWK
jgi:hypothetical protein